MLVAVTSLERPLVAVGRHLLLGQLQFINLNIYCIVGPEYKSGDQANYVKKVQIIVQELRWYESSSVVSELDPDKCNICCCYCY